MQDLPACAGPQVEADPADCYVSRGGLKPEPWLRPVSPLTGSSALDVGQSTGGFTDCLLQAGAARVVGVDGPRSVYPRLASDSRVTRRRRESIVEPSRLPTLLPDFRRTALRSSSATSRLFPDSLSCPTCSFAGGLGISSSWSNRSSRLGEAASPRAGIVRDPALYPVVEDKLRCLCGRPRSDRPRLAREPHPGRRR